MAVPTSRSGRMTTTELRLWRSDQQREIIISPAPAPPPDERNNIVWKTEEPPPQLRRRVPVLYYLSRNGQLQHPHFMEVPLISSSQGLFLSDVINRLNALRGKGMASMYSWSCKRSYKNGFVWHDLSDNDFIYPAHGNHDYVLKGSELLHNTMVAPPPPETLRTGGDNLDRRRRNQSCSSIDELYSVYKAEPCGTSSAAANASTQTDDNRRRRRRPSPAEIVEEEKAAGKESQRDEIEISPPPSDSSPETLETLMKSDGRLTSSAKEDPTANVRRVERGSSKSSVLMQLISCGNSISFRDCGAGSGMGLIRVTRGGGSGESGRMKLASEEREYFSGSIVDDETKKGELVTVTVPAGGLKRSTSYNADRSSHLEVNLEEKEIEGVRAKCIPRKPKTHQSSTTKQNITHISSNVN